MMIQIFHILFLFLFFLFVGFGSLVLLWNESLINCFFFILLPFLKSRFSLLISHLLFSRFILLFGFPSILSLFTPVERHRALGCLSIIENYPFFYHYSKFYYKYCISKNWHSQFIILLESMQEEQLCQVCFINNSVYPTKLSQLISCIKCSVVAHRFCYYPNYDTSSEFICDNCRYGEANKEDNENERSKKRTRSRSRKSNKKLNQTTQKQVCFICSNGGLLKKVNHNLWGHPICLIMQPQVLVKSYLTLEFLLLEQPNKKKTKPKQHKCQICHKSSPNMVKCYEKQCMNYIHWYCLMAQNKKEEDEEKWIEDLKMFEGSYFNQFKVFWNRIKKYIKRINITAYRGIWNQELIDNNEPLKIVHCPLHQLNLINCKCISNDLSPSNTTDWIACDSCNKWYHFKCENLPIGAQINGTYQCLQCLEYHNLLQKNQSPIMKVYPKMYMFDFVHLHCLGQTLQYQDKALQTKVLFKCPFLPSLKYLNVNKQKQINIVLCRTIKLNALEKFFENVEPDSLSYKIDNRKKQVIGILNRLLLICEPDLIATVNLIHGKIIWDLYQVRQLFKKFNCHYPKTKKDSQIFNSIIKRLNKIDCPQSVQQQQSEQQLQITGALATIKEVMGWLKGEKGPSLETNILKFFELMRSNQLLEKHITKNIIEAKSKGWQQFEGFILYENLQHVFTHAIASSYSLQYFNCKKLKVGSLKFLESLRHKFLNKYQNAADTVRKSLYPTYKEIYLDQISLKTEPDCQNLLIARSSTNIQALYTSYPLLSIQKADNFNCMTPNDPEQTGQRNPDIDLAYNQPKNYMIQKQPISVKFPSSKDHQVSLMHELINKLAIENFMKLISRLKLTNFQIGLVDRQYEFLRSRCHIQSSLVDKVYNGFQQLYRYCIDLMEAQKYGGKNNKGNSKSFAEEMPLTQILNSHITPKNSSKLSQFLMKVHKIDCISFYDHEIRESLFKKSVQYLLYLYNRTQFIQNRQELETAKLVYQQYQDKLSRYDAISDMIEQLKQVTLIYSELRDNLTTITLKDLQNPENIQLKIIMLKQARNLSKCKNLEFTKPSIDYGCKIHEMFEQALNNLPLALILPQTFKIPYKYTQKKIVSVDIDSVKYLFGKMQLLKYPSNTFMYQNIWKQYSKAVTEHQIIFNFIKEANKIVFDRLDVNEAQRFDKSDITRLCYSSRLIGFQPEIAQAKKLIAEHNNLLEKLQKHQQTLKTTATDIFRKILEIPFKLQADLESIIKDNTFLLKTLTPANIDVSQSSYSSIGDHFDSDQHNVSTFYRKITNNFHQFQLSQCLSFLGKIDVESLISQDHGDYLQLKKVIQQAQQMLQKSKSLIKESSLLSLRGKIKGKEARILGELQQNYAQNPIKIRQIEELKQRLRRKSSNR